MTVYHRCVLCDGLTAVPIDANRYRCQDCGAVFTEPYRRMVEDIEEVSP